MVLSNLADEALEGELAEQEVRRLLVAADLAEGDGARTVPVWLLDASCCRGGLAGSLRCQLLPGSFTAGGFAGRLLGTSHRGRGVGVRDGTRWQWQS